MVEALELKLGSVQIPLGSIHVSVRAEPSGTVVRFAVLNHNARSCIILDLDTAAVAQLEELLAAARDAVKRLR